MQMKRYAYYLLLYLCNHWITHIPSLHLRLWFYRYVMGFKIGNGTTIMMGARFSAPRRLTIGSNCVINENCVFGNRGGIEIGNCVIIGPDCHLRSGDHDINDPTFPPRYEPIAIGDHVFLGMRSTILKGVKLGKGAVVGACALVTKSCGDRDILVGVPATQIGTRRGELSYLPDWKPLLQ
ncbi:MAG TPA: acyltransferase [Planctomycetaceae bacterium]|nr:acyltransferase [Planctomycetaceae bacterium]